MFAWCPEDEEGRVMTVEVRRGFEDRVLRVGDLDSIRGAAKRTGASVMTIWAWVQAGVVGSTEIGSATVVHVPEVEELVQRMPSRRYRDKAQRRGGGDDRPSPPEGLLVANG